MLARSHAVRRRWVAIVTALVVAAPVAGASPGAASDLQRRQDALERRLDDANAQLDQSGSELQAATTALAATNSRLRAAQQDLATKRAELDAAVLLDTRARARLLRAVVDLEAARDAVSETRARVDEQETRLRQIAVTSYQRGDPSLVALSLILTSSDPATLTGQLNSAESVMMKESATLQRLEAARALLVVRQRDRETAAARVAGERALAADNLRRRRQLELRAEQVETDVRELQQVRQAKRAEAARERSADLRRIRELEGERTRVAAQLRVRAEAARRRAARADRAGQPATNDQTMGWPVRGWVSSPFGMRFHPVFKRWSLHDGVDIAAPCGRPVRAASAGRVISRYFNSAYGNRVIIDNDFQRGVGVATTYNHMSAFSTYVGQRVRRGDIIGYVGTTGASTGCHLHFMVVENGAAADPMDWL